MKIAVIGGGSSYTPELLDGLLDRASAIGAAEVYLHDVHAERLKVVGGFVRRMAAARGSRLLISSGLDLEEAVSGARFVIAQVRVGGNAARREDEKLGRRHGLIGQETTGVGGFAKALRTIPVMLEVCAAMEKHAPSATLINFTNPSGLITEAVLKSTSVQAIGLCNIPITFHLELSRLLGAPRSEVDFDYIGLNHLSWVRQVFLRGEPVTAEVLGRGAAPGSSAKLRELAEYPPEFSSALGMIPMHYLRYYYLTARLLAEQNRETRTRADEVMEIEKELFKIYADPAGHQKPDLLSRRGGAHYSQAALELMEAIVFNRGDRLILNVQNQGTIPELGREAVIECWCRVDQAGGRPLPVRRPEPAIRGLILAVKAYEELTIQAAVEKNYRAALLALVAHPLGPGAERAEKVLQDIMKTHHIKLN